LTDLDLLWGLGFRVSVLGSGVLRDRHRLDWL